MNLRILFFFTLAAFVFQSCSTTKKLADDQYLLVKNDIKYEKKKNILDIKVFDEVKEKLTPIIKQKPNRKFIGLFRLNLAIYNAFDKGKQTKTKTWIKNTIGEPPAILDSALTHKTSHQMQLFLFNKGYFHATVRDSIVTHKKKAKVSYIIDPENPYTVRYKYYIIDDPNIADIVEKDDSTLVTPGKNYDAEALQKERDRITLLLKNQGYFYFSKEYIYYQVDSMLGSRQVDVFIGIQRINENSPDSTAVPQNHSISYVHNIYIETDHEPRVSLDSIPRDTLVYVSSRHPEKKIYILYQKQL